MQRNSQNWRRLIKTQITRGTVSFFLSDRFPSQCSCVVGHVRKQSEIRERSACWRHPRHSKGNSLVFIMCFLSQRQFWVNICFLTLLLHSNLYNMHSCSPRRRDCEDGRNTDGWFDGMDPNWEGDDGWWICGERRMTAGPRRSPDNSWLGVLSAWEDTLWRCLCVCACVCWTVVMSKTWCPVILNLRLIMSY